MAHVALNRTARNVTDERCVAPVLIHVLTVPLVTRAHVARHALLYGRRDSES
jgi:hypothetical protein